jgi:hypothetical protein
MMPHVAARRLLGRVLLLVALLGSVGCATTRASGLTGQTKELVEATRQGNLEETARRADTHWQRRHEEAELARALDLYEKAVEMPSPDLSQQQRIDRLADLWVRLARGRFMMAQEHVAAKTDEPTDQEEARQIALFDKGVTAAEHAMVLLDDDLAKAISGDGESLAEMVDGANPEAIPALYWYATNLSKWGVMEGMATIMQYQSDIVATMKYICREEPSYMYGGCHRYFGAYWTRVPFGKDAAKSKRHFEAALELAPEFLSNRVVMATYYARHVDDDALYRRLLREVAQTDPAETSAAIRPENTFAHRQAERLLAADE